MPEMKEKHILLTIYSIQDYAGAEIHTLSVAKALTEMGADVRIATFNYAYPMREEYEKEGIEVTNILLEKLNMDTYDLIWAHHAVVLDYLIWELHIHAKEVIFNSLSPFEALEALPVYANELSLCLANSSETKEQLLMENVAKEHVIVFPNYVVQKMLLVQNQKSYGKRPDKIAIVSNHVPPELLEFESLAKSSEMLVDIYGKGYQETLVTESLLLKYDLIITIGKTVQYAMGLGIPVYCYDVFGGPGYIEPANRNAAFYYNFSGRGGFSKKQGSDIFDDIIMKYEKNKEYILGNCTFIKEHCVLENNIQKVCEYLNNRCKYTNLKEIRQHYMSLKRSNQAFVREYRYNLHRKMQIEEDIRQMKAMEDKLQEKKQETADLEREIQKLNAAAHENENLILRLYHEMEQKDGSLDQKERNCQYLLEVIQERDRELSEIQHNLWWQRILWLSKWKSRITKYIRHPGLAADRLCRGRQQKNICLPASEVQEVQKELISVVIPVYDRTDILRESITSILNQSYQNFELLLVCDGSPKATLDVVKEYETNEKVRIFRYEDNSGNAVRGRNKAIREAKGEYLAFQDSDDIAVKDRLKLSLEYMKHYDVDIVYGGWKALCDGTRVVDIQDGQEVYSPDCDYEMLRKICVPCQSTVMAKVSVLRSCGGLKTTMRYREDHELWLRLAYNGYKFKSIDQILTILRLHENNLELTYKEQDQKWYDRMMEEHKRVIPMKPKIAYVIPSCGISGGIAVICQHVNRLMKRGYDVLLISEDSSQTAIDWFPNQLVEVCTLEQAPDNIDIAVATGWSTAYTIRSIRAKRKLYFVQSDETRFYPKGSKDYSRALATYHMDYEFITEAKWIQKWLKETFHKDARYVPNALDEKIIYQTEPIAEKGKKFRILLEGPIDIPYKGMEDAFLAVQGLDCEVWCISSAGRPKAGWKCDRFFEKVPMDQMRSIYSSCDLFLKMSRVEGFFGPPLEMMACAGACVVGKVTGYDEYIVDGENALVVEQGDVKGAHDALQRLMEDDALRNHLIENGIKTAQQWRWDTSIDCLEKIFATQP